MQKRPSIYPHNILTGLALTLDDVTQIPPTVWPTGPGYFRTRFRFKFVLVAGTAAGPITEGLMNFVRQIYMKTDADETIVDNLPARIMYKLAIIKGGTAPRVDAIAAASATYLLDVIIHHADPKSLRPEDTVLDTSRYDSITSSVRLGPLTDLFTAPGTATITSTLDITVWRSKYKWDGSKATITGYTSYISRMPVDASSKTEIDFERATDVWLKRVAVHTGTSGAAGRPASGANADTIIKNVSVTDSDDTHVNKVVWATYQDDNKEFYGLESVPAGWVFIDFCEDGSNLSALWSNRNSLKLVWENEGAPAANSFVSLGIEALRALKPTQAEKDAARAAA